MGRESLVTSTTARRTAGKAADSDGVRRFARLGLAGRGLMYGVVAVLAAKVAFGSRAEADRQGALRTIGGNGLGRLALLAVAAGFAGYALWRLAEATVRPGDRGLPGRLASGAKGLLYVGFCVTTASFVVTGRSESSNEKGQDLTARILGWPAGRWLVAAAGAALLAAGLTNAYRAVSGRFRKHLKEHELPGNTAPWVCTVAVVGLLARAVAFSLVGAFVVEAALRYDPEKAQGLDGALRRLAEAPYGRPALLVIAAGLAAFGAWCLVEARYRDVLGS